MGCLFNLLINQDTQVQWLEIQLNQFEQKEEFMAHISGSPFTIGFTDLSKIVVCSFSLALARSPNSAHLCVVVASFSPSKDMLSPHGGKNVFQQLISSSSTKNKISFSVTLSKKFYRIILIGPARVT